MERIEKEKKGAEEKKRRGVAERREKRIGDGKGKEDTTYWGKRGRNAIEG